MNKKGRKFALPTLVLENLNNWTLSRSSPEPTIVELIMDDFIRLVNKKVFTIFLESGIRRDIIALGVVRSMEGHARY